MSHVHLVDARTFNSRQVLRVAPSLSDKHIAGLTFSPDSKHVFVALEDELLEYEVNTKSRRTFGAGGFL
jgi:hypothetical protein